MAEALRFRRGAAPGLAALRAGAAGKRPTVEEEIRRGSRFLAAAGIGSAELDAQVLLCDIMAWDRSRLFSRSREHPDRRQCERYWQSLVRRAGRIPLAYITGRREFWSREITVDGRVLVPRPETELLVETAAGKMKDGNRFLDVGTGSGNIIIAVAAEIGGGDWTGVDISDDALEVAAVNISRHGLTERVSLRRSDLFSHIGEGEVFDVIASNPPYIATAELAALEPEIRCHEPRHALDGGVEGLDVIRRIIADAPPYMAPGGWLLLEIGDGQAGPVVRMLKANGTYRKPEVGRDLAGKERVVAVRRK